jgi:hypothetical protein
LATASHPRAMPTRMASTSACAISIAGGINAYSPAPIQCNAG